MELSKYIACICEGSAEAAIMDSSIDQIASKVKIVEIREISKHYE